MGFICIIIGYALGSLSGAIILSKLKNLPDPRQTGSGNAGATNMLRSTGLSNASLVMIVDLLKGLVAIIIGKIFGIGAATLSLILVATVIGHIFPVFFGFKGGKGFATFIGCLLGISPLVGIICIAVWVGIIYVTEYASLASIITTASAFILMFIFGNESAVFGVLLAAIVIIWAHRDNIIRLKNGNESKTSF